MTDTVSVTNIFDYSTTSAADLYQGTFELPERDSGFSISSYFADILTNELDKQHVVLDIFSKSGKGKSFVAIKIAEELDAKLCAKSGKPIGHYFNLSHICVLSDNSEDSENSALKLMLNAINLENMIIIIDEAADENNGRRAMSKQNVMYQKLYAVIREFKPCIIHCCQFQEFVDKAVRIQATCTLSIDKPMHDLGYNECKFKLLIDNTGNGTSTISAYPLSSDGYTKYTRIRIGLPSKELLESYATKKKENTTNFVKRQIGEYMKYANETDDSAPKQNPQRKAAEEKCMSAWTMHELNKSLSMNACVTQAVCDRETFRRWLRRTNRSPWRIVDGVAVDDVVVDDDVVVVS